MTEAQPLKTNGERVDLAREPDFALGEHFVSPSTLEVTSAGRREILQKRVMQVLVALARRQGEVVSRDELINTCWDGLAISDDAINRCIGRLRKIADLGQRQKFAIETVPRVGYRLTVEPGDAQEANDMIGARATGAVVLSPEQALPPAERAHRLPTPTRIVIMIAAAVVALLLAAGSIWLLSGNRLFGAGTAQVAVASAQVLSADPEVRFFAQGVMDKIAAQLAEADIKVLQAQAPPPHRAEFVVRASAESRTDELRVRIHIDDGPTGAVLWSQEFGRGRGDASALQLEVAAKTADAVAFGLLCAPSRAAATETTSLCLRAAQLLRESDFPRARILLEELVGKTPGVAFAHVLLASAALGEKAIARGDRRTALNTQARNEAQRALALDPAAADGHRILAATLPTRGWTAREAELRKALALGSKTSAFSQSNANAGVGRLLLDAGRASEVSPYMQRATTLDPLSPSKLVAVAAGLEALGRLEEAKSVVEKCVRIWPQDFAVRLYQRYFTLLYGSHDEAITVLMASIGMFPLQPQAMGALTSFIDARAGNDPSQSAKAAGAISAAATAGMIDRRLAVPALAALGAVEEAFAQADRLLADEFAETNWLFVPATAPMRRDPRFMALAARVGLIEYWQKTGWPDFCKFAAPYDCAAVALK